MIFKDRYLVYLSLLLCIGCATIVSESVYPVNITSDPIGIPFEIKNLDKQIVIVKGKTPRYVRLDASSGFFKRAKYIITFGTGESAQQIPLTASIDGWYLLGNLFFGVFIGWLVVDPLTGAMWQIDQEQVSATFDKTARQTVDTSTPHQHQLRLVTYDQVPDHLRNKLVPINNSNITHEK